MRHTQDSTTPHTGGTSPSAVAWAIRLEVATIAWNVMEVVVTIALGIAAGSLALLAFGLDSIVEIGASSAVVWQLGHRGADRTARALAMVGIAFFALAAILLVTSVASLVEGRRPDESPSGIAYLAITAVVMFSLSFWKRRIGARLGEHPLVHEARVTFLDGMLATGVLLALVLNVVFEWWWADAIAAALVGIAAIPEGLDAWRDSRDPTRIVGSQAPSAGSSRPESTS